MEKEKARGFATMAMALTTAAGPATGVCAFIAGAIAQNLCKFFLVKSNYYGSGRNWHQWVMPCGDMWEAADRCGMRLPKQADDIIVEEAHAHDWLALDWKKTSHYVESSASGWLSPEGVFWGCNYGGHINLAHYVIRQSYAALEDAGWVHVDEAGKKGRHTWRMIGEPTPVQADWLTAHGHDLDPEGKKQREMLTLGNIQIDAAADRAAFERMMEAAPKRRL